MDIKTMIDTARTYGYPMAEFIVSGRAYFVGYEEHAHGEGFYIGFYNSTHPELADTMVNEDMTTQETIRLIKKLQKHD